jgi:hypothetical protein
MNLHARNAILNSAVICLGVVILFFIGCFDLISRGGVFLLIGWLILSNILFRIFIRCPHCGHYLHKHRFFYAPWIGDSCSSCKKSID